MSIAAPTYYFDEKRKELCFMLDREQMQSILKPNLRVDENSLIVAVNKVYEEECEKRGPITVKLIARKYMGQPV